MAVAPAYFFFGYVYPVLVLLLGPTLPMGLGVFNAAGAATQTNFFNWEVMPQVYVMSVEAEILTMPVEPAGEMLPVKGGKVNICEMHDADKCKVHQVDDLSLDRTEVTAAQFAAFVQSGKSDRKWYTSYAHSEFCNLGAPGRQKHPLNCVSYFAAKDYCEFVGKRLPTLAEWLRAARGDDDRKYPWGDKQPDCSFSNYHGKEGRGCGKNVTVPVGTFPDNVSPFGIMDMGGNVMEWTTTIAQLPSEDPEGKEIPVEENPRTKRFHMGGSFADTAQTMELDFLCMDSAKGKNISLGFRCASGGR